MRFVCVKEGEDYLMCNGTRYDLHEEALSYKDSTFWVYLGVYVGLVLLAGKEDVTLYFYNSVVLKLTTSAIVVGRSKNLKPNEPDKRNLRMLEKITWAYVIKHLMTALRGVTARFANVSGRQRMRSIRQRRMSVRQCLCATLPTAKIPFEIDMKCIYKLPEEDNVTFESKINVWVNSKTAHAPPPQGKPPGIWLFWKILVKFPAMLPV